MIFLTDLEVRDITDYSTRGDVTHVPRHKEEYVLTIQAHGDAACALRRELASLVGKLVKVESGE